MATLYGDNSQLRNNTPQDMVKVCDLGGRLRVSYDTWTADAAQNDVIVLGRVPKGARIHYAMIKHTAMGTSVTAEIGYLGASLNQNDAIATGYNIAAAGTSTFISPISSTTLTEDVDIVVTLESANPDSGTIQLIVAYSVD